MWLVARMIGRLARHPDGDDGQEVNHPESTRSRANGRGRDFVARPARSFWRVLVAIWLKLNDDWIFNLASLLAYNLLMSIVPILLVLIAVFGLISSPARSALIGGIVQQLP